MQGLSRNTSSHNSSTPPVGPKRSAPEGGASESESTAKRPRKGAEDASSSALTPSRLNADAPTVAGPVAPGPGQAGFEEPRILRDLRRADAPRNLRIPNLPLQGQGGGNHRLDLNPKPRREANELIKRNMPLPNPDGTGPQTKDELRLVGANNLFTNEKGTVQNRSRPAQMITAVEGRGNVGQDQATYVNENPRIKNPGKEPLSHHNTHGTPADKAKLRDFLADGNLNGSGRSITQPEFGLLAGASDRTVGAWVNPNRTTTPSPQVMDYARYVQKYPITANHTPPPIAAGTPPDMSPSQPGYPPTPRGYIHDPYPVPRLNAGPVQEEDVAGPGAGSLPPAPPPLSAHPGNSPATDSDYYGATPLGHPARPAAASPDAPDGPASPSVAGSGAGPDGLASPSPAGSGAGYSPLWDDQSRFDRDQMRIGAFNTPVASPRAQTPQPDLAGAGSPGGPSQPPPTPSLPVLRPGEYVGEGHSLLAQYAPRPQGEDQ